MLIFLLGHTPSPCVSAQKENGGSTPISCASGRLLANISLRPSIAELRYETDAETLKKKKGGFSKEVLHLELFNVFSM